VNLTPHRLKRAELELSDRVGVPTHDMADLIRAEAPNEAQQKDLFLVGGKGAHHLLELACDFGANEGSFGAIVIGLLPGLDKLLSAGSTVLIDDEVVGDAE
jgi:hypothetical protein